MSLINPPIYGCTTSTACNYNSDATDDDGSCDGGPADTNYDCDGNCVVAIDCDGECGGSAVVDDCGVCDGQNTFLDECGICFGDNSSCTGCMDDTACNYDDSATLDSGCEYADMYYDCAGVCLADADPRPARGRGPGEVHPRRGHEAADGRRSPRHLQYF